MKKFLIGIVAAAAMIGCIKRGDEVVNPTLETGTATISGKVYVQSDYLNDSTIANTKTEDSLNTNSLDWEANIETENVFENEAGIEVTATIMLKNLDANDGTSTQIEVVRTTTDANGDWSLTVRTPKSGSIPVTVDYQSMLTTDVTFSLDSINGGQKAEVTQSANLMPLNGNGSVYNVYAGQELTADPNMYADFDYFGF